MVDAFRYPIQVFWSEDDAGFIAAVPDLLGCSAFGETQVEAVNEVKDAIAAWIEAMTAAGNPIPLPSKAVPALQA
jgi:predicted RNase H-like HicB family nuclease